MEDKTEEGDEEFREQGGDLTLWEYSIWGFVNKAFNVSPFIDKEKTKTWKHLKELGMKLVYKIK